MNRNYMKKIFEAKVIQVGPEAQNMIQDAKYANFIWRRSSRRF